MRVSLVLEPQGGELTLPVEYNRLVQGFIYRYLDRALATGLHNGGYAYGKRRFKLFTFSRLLASKHRYNRRARRLTLFGPIRLKIASVETELLESLVTHLVSRQGVYLNGAACYLVSVEVEMPVRAAGPVVVRTLSPIVVYSTLMDAAGKKKTYYYNPWEREFEEKILANLRRKWAALHKSDDHSLLQGAYVKPVKVSKRNEVITKFKGTVIKGWTGLYELYLPEPMFSLAYDAGLGSKNSQGFGMVEIVNREGI